MSIFKAEIDVGIIENAVRAASILVDEAKMNINEEGMQIRAVDLANVCMVSVSLKAPAFDYYDASPLALGLNLTRTADLLKSAKKDEHIEMEYLEEKNRIKFVLDKLSYSLALISLDTIKKEPKTPKIDLPVRVVMDGKEFRRAIKAAEKVSDYITFDAKEDGLKIASSGETSEMSLDILKEDLSAFDIEANVHSMFDLGYVLDIAKALIGAELVEIRIGDNYPIKIISEFAGGKGEIEYLLAPRVEE